jgi:hypothetical protein
MKRNKIFGYDLDLLIEEATKEAMAGLMDKEKIRQQQQQEKNKPFKASKRSQDRVDKDSEEEVEEGDEDTKDLKSPSNVAKNKLPEITIDSIINILNSLRSGKSLKDQQAKKDLKAYFTRLNGAERIALQAFLTGLDKIMGDESDKSGTSAPTPKSEPYDVDMEKKSPKKQKKPAKGSETPIVVGEHANKSKEKLLIRKLR